MYPELPWHLPFLLHARRPEYRRQVRYAHQVIAEAFRCDVAWHVSFSGGKDSTVLLHLVRTQQPDIPAVFSDDAWWVPETETYLRTIPGLHWIRTNAVHTPWFRVTGDYASIQDYAQRQGWTGSFVGLRAAENPRKRGKHLAARGLLVQRQDGHWNCSPLGWWQTEDVWAYILSQGLAYNRAYDVLHAIGVPVDRARLGPLAVERVLNQGQLVWLKRGWPALFHQFAAAYPEARDYV